MAPGTGHWFRRPSRVRTPRRRVPPGSPRGGDSRRDPISRALLNAVLASALVLPGGESAAEVQVRQFGGGNGRPWGEITDLNVLVDLSDPGVLQPRELDPGENLLPQLHPWHDARNPEDIHYQNGEPRIWRGGEHDRSKLLKMLPLLFIDGDFETASVKQDFGPGGNKMHDEYYTIDVGAPVPAERFAVFPPQGIDHVTGEPYGNFTPRQFELSAGNDAEAISLEEATGAPVPGGSNLYTTWCEDAVSVRLECDYKPLEVLLHTTTQNFEDLIDVAFPVQYLRFFRIRPFHDEYWRGHTAYGVDYRLAYAEFAVYGRGFVPEARWQSQVVDLGAEYNFGRLHFGTSSLRKGEDGVLEEIDARADVEIELRTGGDETPVAFFGFNSRGAHVEVPAEEYEDLRFNIRQPLANEQHIGWRGPVGHDNANWGFWSAPVRESGARPRVGKARYFQVRVKLRTDELWEFYRLDSLGVEISPLLAREVLGEVAVLEDLRPEGNLARVRAGETAEFAYDIGAVFLGEEAGFDAVRLMTPASAEFLGLEMGEPPVEVTPDAVFEETSGFTVHLPRRVEAGDPRLRIRLASALYGASATFAGEVFERAGEGLPQAIEPGDVSEEMGTNRLQVVAIASSLGNVLGRVEIEPQVFTPQGDGVNDRVRILYSMLRLNEGAGVEVGVYSLSGERVRGLESRTRGAGLHAAEWDGRDARGEPVPPGLYFARVKVETSQGSFERLHGIAVAY